MGSRLQDTVKRGLAASKPLATLVSPGTLYYSTDLAITERCSDDGSAWESYSDNPGGGVPGLHAPTHISGGTDPVDVTDLAGFPGGGTTFLRDDATFAAPVNRRQVTLIIDGGSSVITTGLKGILSLPVAGTWKKWRLLSIDPAVSVGSIVIDIWKGTYAGYPPVVGGSITAGAKPTLSTVNKNEDTGLTGWTPTFSAGDILGFNVDSVIALTKVSLSLEFE